jgi:transcriptional regulator with XRE-family HTH domain
MIPKDQVVSTTAPQLRAARALLGLSQAEIATRAGISIPTMKRAEADTGIRVSSETIAAIRSVLESAGVEFTNGDAPGVKVKFRNPLAKSEP